MDKHLGKDKFGVCTCGEQLPPLAMPGVYGAEMGRLLYAQDGMQWQYTLAGATPQHDVIEYYHLGHDVYREARVQGKCPEKKPASEGAPI